MADRKAFERKYTGPPLIKKTEWKKIPGTNVEKRTYVDPLDRLGLYRAMFKKAKQEGKFNSRDKLNILGVGVGQSTTLTATTHFPNAKIFLQDIEADSLKLAESEARGNTAGKSKADAIRKIPFGEKMNLITDAYGAATAASDEKEMESYMKQVSKKTAPGGIISMAGARQKIEKLAGMSKKLGFSTQVTEFTDRNGNVHYILTGKKLK